MKQYEIFPLENSMLVTCREHLIKQFVFDFCTCFHYYKRRHFCFYNTLTCKAHPKGCKIIKCYSSYRRSLKELQNPFPDYIISKKMKEVKIVKFSHKTTCPRLATIDSAGYDLY